MMDLRYARIREEMLGSERQRAYRYGMTLLCVGVFFNWLSITDNNSDPVRFVGFTCLVSGALLVCMAICLWANSTRHHNTQVSPERGEVSQIGEGLREPSHATEKPPDYDSVADNTPPPSYADAILLSPANLPHVSIEIQQPSNSEVQVQSVGNGEAQGADKENTTEAEQSRFTRVLSLSKRFIRRTLSSTETEADPESGAPVPAQEAKPS